MAEKEKQLTKKELLVKIKAMGKIRKEQRNEIICSLIGHSHIVDGCMGYVHCGRCGAQIGDCLGGIFDLTNYVIIGHNCKECRKSYKKFTWRDKLYVADPFKKGK